MRRGAVVSGGGGGNPDLPDLIILADAASAARLRADDAAPLIEILVPADDGSVEWRSRDGAEIDPSGLSVLVVAFSQDRAGACRLSTVASEAGATPRAMRWNELWGWTEILDAWPRLEDMTPDHLRDWDERVRTGVSAEEQAARKACAARRKQKLERVRKNGATIPAWWFSSGAWASRELKPSEARALVGLVALVDPLRNNEVLTYEQIAEVSGTSRDTAKRAVAAALKQGLIRKYVRRIPGSNPPRSACFYSLVTEVRPCTPGGMPADEPPEVHP